MKNRFQLLREEEETRRQDINPKAKFGQKELRDELEEKCGYYMNISKLKKLEAGHPDVKIDKELLLAYKKFFGVSADWLIDDSVKTRYAEGNNAIISSVTGLSDASIATLECVKKNWDEKENNILNYIMENSYSFLSFLSWLSIYIDNDYTIPLATDKYNQHIPCNNTMGSVVLGKEIKDNKGNDGYKTIGIGVDILESHAMREMQKIIDDWKNSKKS